MNFIKKQTFNRKYEQEHAVFWLINKHFWKSKTGPISALVIPFFLMIIYKILSNGSARVFMNGLPSYFSFCILPLCLISLPQMIVEFKTSIILRKISTSKISAINFCLLLISYHLLAIIGATGIILISYSIFLNKQASFAFKAVNWYQMIYSLINIYLSCLTLGVLLGVLINKSNLVQIIGFCIIITSITFSGQFIPLTVIGDSNPIRYMSLFSPLSYSLNQMNVVLCPNWRETILGYVNQGLLIPSINQNVIEYIENYHFNGLFDVWQTFDIFGFERTEDNKLSKISIIHIYLEWQNILNLLMPYVFSITFLIISIQKFKWTTR